MPSASPRTTAPSRLLTALAIMVGALGSGGGILAQEEGSTVATSAAESQLENPLPHDEATIKAGNALYLYHCQTCHGRDGKAQDNVDFQAADLTAPDTWNHGTTDAAIFVSTKEGAGFDMPPFKREFEDHEIWQLVHFIRSIGPEELRPKSVPK
jgi:cbb3-type cytochrome c oxidase subunit III